MRLSAGALTLLTTLAATSPVMSQAERDACAPAAAAAMPPDAGPYMPDIKMDEPMPGQMKRDDMMVGDVAKSAEQKRKCMDEEPRVWLLRKIRRLPARQRFRSDVD